MKISQRRAHLLSKRVKELEQKIRDYKRSWGNWPDGKHIMTFDHGKIIAKEDSEIVRVLRLTGHPVIVTEQGGQLHFYGVDL